MLEDAIELSVAGQSPLLKPSELADRGRRLQATMRDIAAIAETAVIIVDKAASQTLDRLHKPC